MIWLIGCNGMLGKELSTLLDKSMFSYIGTDKEIDITDLSALNTFAENKSFAWIINCAAYTAVDRAEEDVEICRRLNAIGAANIASCARSIGAGLVHISTDYVFDGKGNVPYREDDAPNPIGIYGQTKLEGELAVIKNPHVYIIRTAWLYGKYGNNFVATMLKLMNERNEIKVVNDQRGSPTWAFDLASVILNFVSAKTPSGIYHFTNEGNITWFDFAKEIYRLGKELGMINNSCSVLPCSSQEYPSKVQRPAFSVLDKTKIKSALGIVIPDWDKSLKEYLKTCVP